MIAAFLDVSPSPKTNYVDLWRHQDTFKNQEQILEPLTNKFMNRIVVGNPMFYNLEKSGTEK